MSVCFQGSAVFPADANAATRCFRSITLACFIVLVVVCRNVRALRKNQNPSCFCEDDCVFCEDFFIRDASPQIESVVATLGGDFTFEEPGGPRACVVV